MLPITSLILCMLEKKFQDCRRLSFFKLTFLKKKLSGISSEGQTVWNQIRPDILSGLIWVQAVCKGDISRQGVKEFTIVFAPRDIHICILITATGLGMSLEAAA